MSNIDQQAVSKSKELYTQWAKNGKIVQQQWLT